MGGGKAIEGALGLGDAISAHLGATIVIAGTTISVTVIFLGTVGAVALTTGSYCVLAAWEG